MSKKKTRHLVVLRSALQSKTLVVDKAKGGYTWGDTADQAIATINRGYCSVLDNNIRNWMKNPTQGGFVRVFR